MKLWTATSVLLAATLGLTSLPFFVSGERSCRYRLRVYDSYNENTGGTGWRWTGDTYCVERESDQVPSEQVIFNKQLKKHDFKAGYSKENSKIKRIGDCKNKRCEDRGIADGCTFVEEITIGQYNNGMYDCGKKSYNRQLRGGWDDDARGSESDGHGGGELE